MRNTPSVIALLAIVSIAVSGCSPPAEEPQIEFRVPVFVKEVGTGTVEDRIIATGTLRAPETIALRADTAGELRLGTDSAGRA